MSMVERISPVENRCHRDSRRRCSSLRIVVLGVVVSASATALSGCARRTLTITQQDYINTCIHRYRDNIADRVGEPLEVNIVCVYPSDLNKGVNAPLAPDQHITSDVWYARRPEVDRRGEKGIFDLPPKQIYLLTDDPTPYGNGVGARLRGAKKDGKKQIKITGIDFKEKGKLKYAGSLFSGRSVLYVFPRFLGPEGQVLPIEPAKFHPPGAYRRYLFVEIGVTDRGGNEDQYIKNTTPRKMHKRKGR